MGLLLKAFISESSSALSALYPPAEAHSIVLRLCTDLLGVQSYTHIIDPSFEVPSPDVPRLEEAFARLLRSEPIQYVLGHTLFCGLDFRVTPAVLIPRPETEEIVVSAISQAVRLAENKPDVPVRILDLCTGSGCIAWTLALSVPGCEVVAVDLSDEALEVARSQDFKTLLRERKALAPLFLKADVLSDAEGFDHGVFDLIISNPPYVMDSQKAQMHANVLDYEPSMALFVRDADPLVFYRAIARWARLYLTRQGCGIVEINDLLGPETEALFHESGFSATSLNRDLSGRCRSVLFRA